MNTLTIVTVSCYLATSIAQALRFAGKITLAKRYLLGLYAMAIAGHGFLLYRWIDTQFGQNLSMSNLFSFTAWLAGLFILLPTLKKPLENLLMFLTPIAASSVLWIILFPWSTNLHQTLSSTDVWHILIALSSAGLLGVAGLQAILVWFQNHALKVKKYTPFVRLFPPLETMEQLLFQIIGVGFILLSIALFTGLWLSRDTLLSVNLEKFILSIIAWLLFAILLVGHYFFGWRGPKAIRWTLIGSALLPLAYFGSKFAVGLS